MRWSANFRSAAALSTPKLLSELPFASLLTFSTLLEPVRASSRKSKEVWYAIKSGRVD